MRITLINFGVWANKTFEFPDKGLTLISGPSGKGKTTIFRAINYVLTGEGTKLPTLGEKKCTAIFEYQGMVMTRTNSPCRLTVVVNNIQYEGDEAQSIIYQTVGKNFEIAGYIHQKGENSFLGMSPSDKLKFLEKVAFYDVPIDEIKEKAKDMVSKYELNLSSIQGELKYIQDNPVLQPDTFPYTNSTIVKKIAELKANIQTLTLSRDKIEKEKIKQHLLKEKRINLIQRISDIKLENVPETLNSNGEEDELKLHSEYIEYQRAKKNISELEVYVKRNTSEIDRLTASISQLTLSTQEERNELIQELNELTSTLQEYKTQQEHIRLISEFSKDRYDFLSSNVPQSEEKLRLLLQSKESRVCPGCKIHLRVMKDTLEVFGSELFYTAEKERELKTQITEWKKELTTLEVLKRQIDRLPKLEDELELDQSEFEQAIKDLKKTQTDRETIEKNYTELTKDLNKAANDVNIKKMKESIDAFSKKVEPLKPIREKSDLEKLISDRKIRVKEIEKVLNDNQTKQRRKADLEKELSSLQESVEISSLDIELESVSEQIKNSHQEHLKYTQLEKDSQLHQKNVELYTKFITSEKRVRQTLLDAEKQFTLAKKFKENVHTAEMLALNGIIEELNSHLALYLSVFFPDNPLTLNLCLFKANEKTKIVKNQVNIQVGYRGATTDLTTLSGGEKDRVNLAFTLALAEIFNIPLLMLDETLSSLDREGTENILEHIQKDSRCILVVAHQVSHGLFDHVYTV
jgi:DNA repair exonuclease SbcCD ATPase subunit